MKEILTFEKPGWKKPLFSLLFNNHEVIQLKKWENSEKSITHKFHRLFFIYFLK